MMQMKTDFKYSTDYYAANAPELANTCLHLICTAGEGSLVHNGRCYHIRQNDLVVIPYPHHITNLAAHPDMQVEWFAADIRFLQSLLPANNYSIGGSITLYQDPVIHLTETQALHLLNDFHRLSERLHDRHLVFYHQLMGSLCLTMMYDIFEPHALRDTVESHTDRTAFIMKQFTELLATGISRTEREVGYYARQLHVSPKYLSTTVKHLTGHSVTHYINSSTVPLLKELLSDERLSLTQIADYMHFSSLSYFSRYCAKHIGMSPSEYRQSLQPKAKDPDPTPSEGVE
jgi:AraC-like DNA-binding protein